MGKNSPFKKVDEKGLLSFNNMQKSRDWLNHRYNPKLEGYEIENTWGNGLF